jgi:hypothetical protein
LRSGTDFQTLAVERPTELGKLTADQTAGWGGLAADWHFSAKKRPCE